MMENLVSIDPTDHQKENMDADCLKKLLILEVVGILGDSEFDQKIYNFQIIQKKIFSLVIVEKQTFSVLTSLLLVTKTNRAKLDRI